MAQAIDRAMVESVLDDARALVLSRGPEIDEAYNRCEGKLTVSVKLVFEPVGLTRKVKHFVDLAFVAEKVQERSEPRISDPGQRELFENVTKVEMDGEVLYEKEGEGTNEA